MRKMGEKAKREEKTFVIDKLEDIEDTGQTPREVRWNSHGSRRHDT